MSNFLQNTAADGFDITPNDSVDLADEAGAIYVGGAGDIALITSRGTTLTFTALNAGTILPFKVSRVLATGTTATNLIGATIQKF